MIPRPGELVQPKSLFRRSTCKGVGWTAQCRRSAPGDVTVSARLGGRSWSSASLWEGRCGTPVFRSGNGASCRTTTSKQCLHVRGEMMPSGHHAVCLGSLDEAPW